MLLIPYIITFASGKQISLYGTSQASALLAAAELIPNDKITRIFIEGEWD